MVIIVVCFDIIWSSAEGIGFVVFARFVVEFVVVLLEFNLPGGSSRTDFLQGCPVHEVFVVCPDDHW